MLEFQVAAAGTPDVATLRLDLGQEAVARPALKALFGARRVQGLEFLIQSRYSEEDLNDQLERLGYDPVHLPAGRPGEAPSVYAENALAAGREALRGLLVAEAMHYGLACSETAFVAVRTEAGQQVQGSVAVANALASGWSDDFVELRIVAFGQAAGGLMAEGYRPPGAAAPSSIFARLWPFRRRPGGRLDAARLPSRAQSSAPVEETAAGVLFSGVPLFADGESVLFDSSRDQDTGKLPERATINRLEVRFPGGTPADEGHDAGLALLIFVDDLSSPRARVRLADVASQGGERPLNLLRSAGEVVRIVLLDPAGAWTRGAQQIEVVLAWRA